MKDLQFRHLALISIFLLLGCQETEILVEDPEDPDMELALELANEHLSSSRRKKSDLDVTVLKYKKEDLIYKTNRNGHGYDLIEEMTITAVTKPGGFVFWKAAGGVKKLIEIEFDQASQELLGYSRPYEVKKNDVWALYIPHNFDVEQMNMLKYDIIYETKKGEIIRLDPKIKIRQSAD